MISSFILCECWFVVLESVVTGCFLSRECLCVSCLPEPSFADADIPS